MAKSLKRTPKFEVFQSEALAPEWRWHLKTGNGEIIASGEGYTRERDAWRAVANVKVAIAKIVEAEK